MDERRAYELKIEAMLPEWREKIDMMADKAPTIAPAKRGAYDELIQRMRLKLSEAERLLAGAATSAESSWRDAHAALARAWGELTNAYEKALCQFEGVKN